MSFVGDFLVGTTFDFYFTTRRFSTGAPHTLAGTPSLAAYEDNSTTQITAGLTLDVDFDGVTGLNHVRVVATGGNGYEAGKSYAVVIAAGTVDSVTVAGEIVGNFNIERMALVDSAITAAKIAADAITAAKIANGAIDAATFAAGAIDAAAIADNAIDAASIAADAITAAKIANGAIDAATFAAGAIDAAALAADASGEIADAVWDEAMSGHTTLGSYGQWGRASALSGEINDAGATTTVFVVDGFTEATNDHFNGSIIVFTSGANAGQCRTIIDYAGGTQTITLGEALTDAPADNDDFVIVPGPMAGGTLQQIARLFITVLNSSGQIQAGTLATDTITAAKIAADAITAAKVADGTIDAATFAAGAINAAAIANGAIDAATFAAGAIDAAALAADASAEIADAVWDEDATGHQTQGSFGQAIGDPGADTDTIWGLANTNLNATVSSRASQTSVDTIDDFLDTEVAAILAAVDTEVAAILALLDDARTEPGQGNPPVNPDLATKIDYLYKSWRNKKDNDGATTNLYNDDGTTIGQKQTTSEAAGTVTKGEWITGA